jgi:hypothetical protein
MGRQDFFHQEFQRNKLETSNSTSQASFSTEITATEMPIAEDYDSQGSVFDGLVVILWCLFAGVVVFFWARKLSLAKDSSSPSESLDDTRPLSCSRCRYFSKNPYLKCAIHPLSVQKIDAHECPDFYGKD